MRKLRFAASALSFALFLISYVFAEHSVRADTSLKFRLVHKHFIVVPVRVNGEGPFEFLLDTGTNTTLIATELAERLKLRAIDRIYLITATGSQVVPRSHLHEIVLGSKSVGNVEALFTELRVVRSLDPAISGVLGQNFLSKFNFTLNYRDRHIDFEDDGAPTDVPPGNRLHIERNEGKIMVSAEGASQSGTKLQFVLDSGISGLVLFISPARRSELNHIQRGNSFIRAFTDTGSDLMRLRRLPFLRVGSETFLDIPAVLALEQQAETRAEDGLLPTSLFRSIYFNNKEGYVILHR